MSSEMTISGSSDAAVTNVDALERVAERLGLTDIDAFHVGEHYADTVGDVIAVRGQIQQRSSVDPKLEVGVFECARCGSRKQEDQGYGRISEPLFCPGCETKTTPWLFQRGPSEYVDFQAIRLQPVPEKVGEGKETIDGYLKDALARRGLESGEEVTVVAKYKAIHEQSSTVATKALEVQDVIVEDNNIQEADVEAHRETIDALAAQRNPFDTLIASVAPHHHGDPHIKEGLILQLVRGASLDGDGGQNHRGTVHQLLLGDPGTGKTDFGDALVALSPRAQKASGNEGTSAAGLTAAMTKDGFEDRDLTVTAGAIPKCSGGAIFIDELDSAGSPEQNAMLEAMESQVINIEKAGTKATLQADTAILAAGNPDDGHFKEDVKPAEQTTVISPLLDRFDLIFCPRERTERDEIDDIAGHILDSRDVASRRDQGEDVPDELVDDVDPEIETDALRAYLMECREITPTFASSAVKEALRAWYVEVKTRLVAREQDEGRTIPVTPRSLLDLVRLAESSAKARHSDEIEMIDAERATRLKSRSFREFGLEPGPDIEVQTDDDGGLVVDSEAPTAVVLEAVEELKFDGADYGADRDAVVDLAATDADDLDEDDVQDLVDSMLSAETLNETPDGRLIE